MNLTRFSASLAAGTFLALTPAAFAQFSAATLIEGAGALEAPAAVVASSVSEGKGMIGVLLTGDAGAPTIQSVIESSPAERAGFKSGDVITSVGGTEVATLAEMQAQLKGLAIGDKVKIGYDRDGSSGTRTLVLADSESLDLPVEPGIEVHDAPKVEFLTEKKSKQETKAKKSKKAKKDKGAKKKSKQKSSGTWITAPEVKVEIKGQECDGTKTQECEVILLDTTCGEQDAACCESGEQASECCEGGEAECSEGAEQQITFMTRSGKTQQLGTSTFQVDLGDGGGQQVVKVMRIGGPAGQALVTDCEVECIVECEGDAGCDDAAIECEVECIVECEGEVACDVEAGCDTEIAECIIECEDAVAECSEGEVSFGLAFTADGDVSKQLKAAGLSDEQIKRVMAQVEQATASIGQGSAHGGAFQGQTKNVFFHEDKGGDSDACCCEGGDCDAGGPGKDAQKRVAFLSGSGSQGFFFSDDETGLPGQRGQVEWHQIGVDAKGAKAHGGHGQSGNGHGGTGHGGNSQGNVFFHEGSKGDLHQNNTFEWHAEGHGAKGNAPHAGHGAGAGSGAGSGSWFTHSPGGGQHEVIIERIHGNEGHGSAPHAGGEQREIRIERIHAGQGQGHGADHGQAPHAGGDHHEVIMKRVHGDSGEWNIRSTDGRAPFSGQGRRAPAPHAQHDSMKEAHGELQALREELRALRAEIRAMRESQETGNRRRR